MTLQPDGGFEHEGGYALVLEVTPTAAFGVGTGGYSQTRWTFGAATRR